MKLNVKKLRECDVIKIAWSEEIINGNKKITIK